MKGLEMRGSSEWDLNAVTGHLERVRRRESEGTLRRAVSVESGRA